MKHRIPRATMFSLASLAFFFMGCRKDLELFEEHAGQGTVVVSGGGANLTSWFCVSGNCLELDDESGPYATRSDCEANCSTNNTGTITELSCNNATHSGTLTQGQIAGGVSSSVPYSGGNGEAHSGQTVNSTGVTGLTATLSAGTFNNGNGNVVYTITGMPSDNGTASFALSIGGQSCGLVRSITSTSPTYPSGTVHCGSTPTTIVEITNPTTGKTWMDRNLGASRVAISPTDDQAFGDLYQWGRFADGHQCRSSSTTPNLSGSDKPSHGNFIIVSNSPFDWRSPQNDNLWQGVNGANNPCPIGFRLPTETELNSERISWTSNDSAGAFSSQLKLPAAGIRDGFNGSLQAEGQNGSYWSSVVSMSNARLLSIGWGNAIIASSNRDSGRAIRCIKD
ncbi:MAG: hypothetical protein JJU02_03420 [Cryomorphaceae bacterium]|nr:hypothetical protein [Cryomorphaceae bacterium]